MLDPRVHLHTGPLHTGEVEVALLSFRRSLVQFRGNTQIQEMILTAPRCIGNVSNSPGLRKGGLEGWLQALGAGKEGTRPVGYLLDTDSVSGSWPALGASCSWVQHHIPGQSRPSTSVLAGQCHGDLTSWSPKTQPGDANLSITPYPLRTEITVQPWSSSPAPRPFTGTHPHTHP